MPSESLYLSTRDVAHLSGCEPHVIYTSLARNKQFRGVVPRKGAGGRLSWPADEVRATLPEYGCTPSGLDFWIEYLGIVVPEVSEKTASRLGIALLGSEATCGWQALPGQFSEERLELETGIIGMALQGLIERIDQAEVQSGGPIAAASVEWLIAVTRNALRFKTTGAEQ